MNILPFEAAVLPKHATNFNPSFIFNNGMLRLPIVEHTHNNFIIPIGVGSHPHKWLKTRNVFKILASTSLTALKERRALLLIDQSLEGYQIHEMWDIFHTQCNIAGIAADQLIYVTGNANAPAQYTDWCIENSIEEKIKVISIDALEYEISKQHLYCDWDHNLTYKQNYSQKIYTYNLLNKRPRNHRIWFYNMLYKEHLISKGLVSMNMFNNFCQLEGKILPNDELTRSTSILPITVLNYVNEPPDGPTYWNYVERILTPVYENSWISIVPESAFADDELSTFITEKTFKSIASMHPFIILGGKGSLKRLREIGYKTFDGHINESYDQLPTFERLDAIVVEIKRIDSIEDKAKWFSSMKDIIVHNYNVLLSRKQTLHPSISLINSYYTGYFKL